MEHSWLMLFPLIRRLGRSTVTLTHPTTGILTPQKVTIRHQLVVPSSSSDDDIICYIQEPALMPDSPLSSPLPYIVLGQWVGVGCGKVLIPNPEYKGKGHTESASSNLTPRVQRCCPPPKIRGPPGMMEFTDNDMEEEKEELSNELMASLK
jgi:hypothetical protein